MKYYICVKCGKVFFNIGKTKKFVCCNVRARRVEKGDYDKQKVVNRDRRRQV